MNLFGNKRTKLYFASAKLHRNHNGEKTASVLFKVRLDGQNIRSTPGAVQMSYKACKEGSQTEAKLEGGIAVQNVTLYATDKSRPFLKLKEVIFDHIALQRSKDSEIYICMRASLDISTDSPVREWTLETFGTEQWGEFEDAQMKLSFAEEESGEETPKRSRKKSDIGQLPLEEEGEEDEEDTEDGEVVQPEEEEVEA